MRSPRFSSCYWISPEKIVYLTVKSFFGIFGAILLMGLLARPAGAQSVSDFPGQVEVFAGVDIHYRNIMASQHVYNLLIYATPAVKWHPGKDWILSVQGAIPVVNHFGDYYRYPRLNMAVVSKELYWGAVSCKFSGGIFSRQRYGLDAKCQWAVTPWFALEGQLGFTGYYEMTDHWAFSPMDRLTGRLSACFYLPRSQTEFRLSGGRYIYADYGVQLEWLQHFSRFCTVGAFVQAGNRYGSFIGYNSVGGGAKLILAIPWKWQATRRFTLRPASNFRLTHDMKADEYGLRMYATDPEENERSGHFARSKWGFGR